MRLIKETTIINVVVLFALLNAAYLIYYKHMPAMFAFLLTGLIVSFFTRNVTIVLTIAIIAAHSFIMYKKHHKEGLENKDKKSKKNSEDDDEPEDPIDEDDDMGDDFANMSKDQLKDMISKRKDIQEDLTNILKIQNEVVGGAQKLEPLMKKTEAFINKYKHLEDLGRKFMNESSE